MEDTMLAKTLSFLIISLTIISCSSFVESTRKALLGDDNPRAKKSSAKPKWVSKSQYDDLVVKYKTLSDKYENLRDQNLNQSSGFDQIAEMSKKSSPETVDVFGKNGISNESVNTMVSKPSNIEEEVSYYKRGLALVKNKKPDEALKLFQFLENSSVPQLSVRAKLQIGDIYFSKNQYDLALQVYEGIMRKHAFSGTVLSALKHAVVCSTQLGLADKQAQFESLLKDVFGMQV